MQRTLLLSPNEAKTHSKTLTNLIDKPQSEINLDDIDKFSSDNSIRLFLASTDSNEWNEFLSKITEFQDLKGNVYMEILDPSEASFTVGMISIISDIDNIHHQTLVEENSIENKPIILTLPEAILELRKSIELIENEIEEFNKKEYKRLDEIPFDELDV